MKKSFYILSILAVISSIFALLSSIAALTILWTPLKTLLYGSYDYTPVIPLGIIANMIFTILFCVFMLLTNRTETSIVLEIVAIAILFLIPYALSSLSLLQNWIIGEYYSYLEGTALSISIGLISFPNAFAGISRTICYFLLGMRIADKVHLKNKKVCQAVHGETD